MCKWGESIQVWVKIMGEYSHDGKPRWKLMDIDSCIAPIVRGLQNGNIDMISSCCGHGKGPGEILLADGRKLIIEAKP
jgi:hypothetical protein